MKFYIIVLIVYLSGLFPAYLVTKKNAVGYNQDNFPEREIVFSEVDSFNTIVLSSASWLTAIIITLCEAEYVLELDKNKKG